MKKVIGRPIFIITIVSVLISVFFVTKQSIFRREANKVSKMRKEPFGSAMPLFSISLVNDSGDLSTSTISKGKRVVFFVVDPYCPICKAQLTEILENNATLSNISFWIISVFPKYQLLRMATDFNLKQYSNIEIGVDTKDITRRYFDIQSVPCMLFYDENGKFIRKHIGSMRSVDILKSFAK